jgi:hypothetical protein
MFVWQVCGTDYGSPFSGPLWATKELALRELDEIAQLVMEAQLREYFPGEYEVPEADSYWGSPASNTEIWIVAREVKETWG